MVEKLHASDDCIHCYTCARAQKYRLKRLGPHRDGPCLLVAWQEEEETYAREYEVARRRSKRTSPGPTVDSTSPALGPPSIEPQQLWAHPTVLRAAGSCTVSSSSPEPV